METVKDATGKTSSKRVWGSILIINGILQGNALFIRGLFYEIADKNITADIFKTFLGVGAGLLGLGLIELFRKKQ